MKNGVKRLHFGINTSFYTAKYVGCSDIPNNMNECIKEHEIFFFFFFFLKKENKITRMKGKHSIYCPQGEY